MKLALLADQHGNLPPIPECDLLVIAGDVCGGPGMLNGKWTPDLTDNDWWSWLNNSFASWIKQAPTTVVVAGNHDTAIQRRGFPKLPNVYYLQDTWVNLNGALIWGTPWIKRFDNLAFNADEDMLEYWYSRIPVNTLVIVSHGPPYGYGDRLSDGTSFGSKAMLAAINRVKPKLVVCGHAHEARGEYWCHSTRIINTACGFTVVEI